MSDGFETAVFKLDHYRYVASQKRLLEALHIQIEFSLILSAGAALGVAAVLGFDPKVAKSSN